ncbi:hypothetical protein AVEN_47466-1 [Araneus ventricosus]|uniref:Uncharacterized protein n=1 Tax=Araneus ventricosus TaxID=182803 RepID=A0A4Y2QJ81_ARAVE|nr:hypothetical protein AVEN_47466-1 [Araneus ventricosus]
MDKWLKTGTLKRSASRTGIRTTDLAAVGITVDQQDDNYEVQRPTDWPVQLKDKVITFASVNNSAKIGKEKISVDPLTLFHRICVAKQSDEDLKMFFTFELSPFPSLLFNEEGMRKGTKSSLFSAFTPTKIDAVQGKNNFVVVDGGHLLHKVVWQRNMNFGDIAKSYLTYLQTHYGSNVAVVFDAYPSDVNGKSTKISERTRRANLIHHIR